MRERFQRILSVLCVLALALMAFGAVAEEPGIVTVQWSDENNADGLRPESVTIGGAELNASGGWTGMTAGAAALPEVPGYTAASATENGVTAVTYTHKVVRKDVTANVVWEDANNAKGIRPSTLPLRLTENGSAYTTQATAGATNSWAVTWPALPTLRYGTRESAVYGVAAPQVAGYTQSISGLTVTYTLQTGTLSLEASVTGAPEGADLSGLRLKIDGPDATMPVTLTWGQLTGGTYSFGSVVPGTYLVEDLNADTLVPGYGLSGSGSRVADAVQVKAGESKTLTFRFVYGQAEAVDPDQVPNPGTNLNALSFEILGPDERLPMTVTYAQFVNGQYELSNLAPGSYTVVERNAETLVDSYTLRSDSVTGLHLAVTAGGTATAALYNHYTPAPTPEPGAVTVNVPVVKTWNDNNNADGNRPAQVTVRLYADGTQVDSVALSAANSWMYTFENLPRYTDAGVEIAYTISEDPVPQYRATIRGFSIVNDYEPEVVSASVSKIWNDNGNAAGLRPLSIAMSLSNGRETVAVAVLNENNGWTATINNLPAQLDGQAVTYTWTEQQTIGYYLDGLAEDGNNAVFTNALYERPQVEAANLPARRPGNTFFIFEDYDTPLGVEIMINHVGDCFD